MRAGLVIALSLGFFILLTPLVSAASYRGVIMTISGWNTGINSAFLAVRVYRVETERPGFTLPYFGIPYPPIRYPPAKGWWRDWIDYLFYINGSGAYLVERLFPDSPLPRALHFSLLRLLGLWDGSFLL
ncbi:hypothetical protein [Thermococcus sp.]